MDLETRRTEPDALRRLRTAITRRNIVRFDYINAQNERTTRDPEPLRLHFKYRNWYVYGFCLSRQAYREFRLSRMMNVRLTQDAFEPHHDVPDTAALSNKEWQDQLEEVVIRVRTGALTEAMDQFHQADKQFHDDGSMTMRVPVHQPLEARWLWTILLSFGSGAEVLKPLELRKIIKDQLRNTLKLYEDV